LKLLAAETLYLEPVSLAVLLRAAWCALRKITSLAPLLVRVLAQGSESPGRRARALLHTLLGACYAVRLQDRGVDHIHVHHGYFSCWIALIAARLLGIEYSVTLHGSDLLLNGAYLDLKLKHCKFCVTVSEFNRRFVLQHYPGLEADKIMVRRMGVSSSYSRESSPSPAPPARRLTMLAVGRLHPVKDHAFLLHACYELKTRGTDFLCLIAGEGRQRPWLEHLIRNLGLETCVKLLGHLSREGVDACYGLCDLVVLTSRSEGIPLVLMEAMSCGKTVLAPSITGIPELVSDGDTGFLYRAGSLDDFVSKIDLIRNSQSELPRLRLAAREHVLQHFDREKNLAAFVDLIVSHLACDERHDTHENPVLQQI
jgi:glycosyltransferase involved in cell wall biosynthesis